MMRTLKAVDLFCGAGGTSQGAEQSGAAKVICAVNHWHRAVETHSANFPNCKHINSRLDQVNPSECDRFDLLFASPECTGHSNARGGAPTSDQKRSGAWDVLRWVEHHRPSYLVIENVMEFRDWGPVDPKTGQPIKKFKGRYFDSWLKTIASGGYRVDHYLFNAADFGAATSRTRLFVVARKGNRSFPIPEPTHAQRIGGELPGMGGMRRWRAAAEIIDWQIPCPSVFLKSTPLADKTLLRIDAGLRRFVGPYVVELRNNMTARGSGEPVSTITADGNHHWVAVPFQMKATGCNPGLTRGIGDPMPTQVASAKNHSVVMPFVVPRQGCYDAQTLKRCRGTAEPLNTITASHIPAGVAMPFIKPNFNERDGQAPRSHDLYAPLPTVTTRGAGDLAVPFIYDSNHGESGGSRTRPIDSPVATITKKIGQYLAVPLIVTYYSNGKAYSVDEPLCTLSTRDRCGLAMAIIETAGTISPRTEGERRLLATMIELGVADVGYRMLSNPELAAAQGFPASYIFHGNKGEVTKQIGNAVVPNVAEAITNAIAGAA